MYSNFITAQTKTFLRGSNKLGLLPATAEGHCRPWGISGNLSNIYIGLSGSSEGPVIYRPYQGT